MICVLGGDDTIHGHNGDDVIYAGSGNDRSYGEGLLSGIVGLLGLLDNGSDTIYGGPGNDNLDGQNGNDTLVDSDGTDTLSGGNGTIVTADGSGGDTANGRYCTDICTTDQTDTRSSCCPPFRLGHMCPPNTRRAGLHGPRPPQGTALASRSRLVQGTPPRWSGSVARRSPWPFAWRLQAPDVLEGPGVLEPGLPAD